MKKTILSLLTLPVLGLSVALADHHKTDADNSARNERDRSGETVTSFDQSNEQADLDVVQAIRKAIVAHDSLSVNAKNVKIVTDATRVVLRGPVKSEEEKTVIDQLAKDNAGGRRVENQIEIETKD